MTATVSAPAPVCAVFLRSSGTGEVLINRKATLISCVDVATARRRAMEILSEAAREHGSALTAVCSDPEGLYRLTIDPDGRVSEAERDSHPARKTSIPPGYATVRAHTPPPALRRPAPFISQAISTATDEIWEDGALDARHALRAESGDPLSVPTWRGKLARRGVRRAAAEADLTDQACREAIAKQWTSTRTIAVVNGKGGAGKTPTTICLAAVFAREGGGRILAWDNNQTRGTLGWRTEQGQHEATLLDLLPEVPRLLRPYAHASELAGLVHHQALDRYDVLRSKSAVLADEQRITSLDVDAIWTVAAKFYRLIIMDSGNDESDPMWRSMIDHTDQLVTVTTTRADHAEAGALLLEALWERDDHSARLAQNSVTIITQADPRATQESIRSLMDGYAFLSRDVAFIPYDPAMVEGTLAFDNLRPATQRSWLVAAASVASGLAEAGNPYSNHS